MRAASSSTVKLCIDRALIPEGLLRRCQAPSEIVRDGIVELAHRSGTAATQRGEPQCERPSSKRGALRGQLGRATSLFRLPGVGEFKGEDVVAVVGSDVEGDEAI